VSKVHTAKGLIDRDLLMVEEIVTEDDNSRAVATEWRTLDGELVRRDAHVMILRGHELAGAVQEIG
jgi:hypothetical protein